jgi:hypothetical protein
MNKPISLACVDDGVPTGGDIPTVAIFNSVKRVLLTALATGQATLWPHVRARFA